MRKLALAALMTLGIPLWLWAAKSASEVAQAFWDKLVPQQYGLAYAYCSPALQEQLDEMAFAVLWRSIDEAYGPLRSVSVLAVERVNDKLSRVPATLEYRRRTISVAVGVLKGQDGNLLIDSITLPEDVLPVAIQPPEELRRRARNVVDKLMCADFQGAWAMLDPELREKLPVAALEQKVRKLLGEGGGTVRSTVLASQRSMAAGLMQTYFFRCEFPVSTFGACVGAMYDGREWHLTRLTVPCAVPPPFEVSESAEQLLGQVIDGQFEKAYGLLPDSITAKQPLREYQRQMASLLTAAGRRKTLLCIREGYLDADHREEYCFLYRLVFDKATHLAMVRYVPDVGAQWKLFAFEFPYQPPVPKEAMSEDAKLCLRLLATRHYDEARAMMCPTLRKSLTKNKLQENIDPVLAAKGSFVSLTLSDVKEQDGVHTFTFTLRFKRGVLDASLDYAFVGGSWAIVAVRFPS